MWNVVTVVNVSDDVPGNQRLRRTAFPNEEGLMRFSATVDITGVLCGCKLNTRGNQVIPAWSMNSVSHLECEWYPKNEVCCKMSNLHLTN